MAGSMRLMAFLLVTWMAWFPPSAGAAGPQGRETGSIRYERWPDEPDSRFAFSRRAGDAEGYIFLADDIYTRVTYCDERKGFVCFETGDFAFAYPLKRRADERSWICNGIRYDVVREGFSRTFLGRQFDNLILIRQPKDSTVLARHFSTDRHYLYSEERGIIAFGDVESPRGGPARFYLLSGEVGFGALRPQETPDSANAAR